MKFLPYKISVRMTETFSWTKVWSKVVDRWILPFSLEIAYFFYLVVFHWSNNIISNIAWALFIISFDNYAFINGLFRTFFNGIIWTVISREVCEISSFLFCFSLLYLFIYISLGGIDGRLALCPFTDSHFWCLFFLGQSS